MDKKWNILNGKGYLKIHISVNMMTKEIVAPEITNETVHYGIILYNMVIMFCIFRIGRLDQYLPMDLTMQTVILGILN